MLSRTFVLLLSVAMLASVGLAADAEAELTFGADDFIFIDLLEAGTTAASVAEITAGPTLGTLFNTANGFQYEAGDAIDTTGGSVPVTFLSPTTGFFKVAYEPLATSTTNAVDTFSFTIDGVPFTGTIFLIEDCPALFVDKIDGTTVTPPSPDVSLEYDSAGQVFTFTVEIPYVRDSAFVIDFNEYALSDSIYSPASCENRDAADFPNPGTDFPSYFETAPTATFPGALQASYLGYPPSTRWTATAVDCSTVSYTATFTFSELVGCTTRDGSGSSITVVPDAATPFTDYRGSVFVHVISPLDPADESAGYTRVMWEQEFVFRFNMLAIEITTVGSVIDFVPQVLDMFLAVDGSLELTLQTEVAVEINQQLLNPTGTVAPESFVAMDYSGPVVPTPVDGAPLDLVQEWSYTSQEVANVTYDGDYVFRWTFFPSGDIAVAQFRLFMEPNPIIQKEFSFNTELTVYNENFAAEFSGPFGSGDRISVKDSLVVSAADLDNFEITVQDVYICYSDNLDFIPTYDPENNRNGCIDAIPGVMPAENIFNIIIDGAVNAALPDAAEFDTQLHDTGSFPGVLDYLSTKGFSIASLPLAARRATYYFHVETLIEQVVSKKRSIQTIISKYEPPLQEEGLGNTMASFYVIPPVEVDPGVNTGEPLSSSAAKVIPAAFFVAACFIAVFA